MKKDNIRLFGQLKSRQRSRLYTVKWGKLWLIRIFQVAIFDLSNHNSHSSLLHQCWWGYFRTNSLSRRNMGLTLCNNIKHCFPHCHDSPSARSGAQMKLSIMLLQIWWGKGMTAHLEIIAQTYPKSQKWRRGRRRRGRRPVRGRVLVHSLSV